jgi:hypothetical protein
MKQMIRDQESEDIQKREQQRAAQRRYQQELDSQLNELRQRSIDSLQSNILILSINLFLLFLFSPFVSFVLETMSENEAKYNSDLIQKTAVYLHH